MTHVTHRSIGEASRKIEEEVQTKAERRKEIIEKYVITPWHNFTLDQLSVWVAWATVAASVFLYCTVSAVMMAVR